MPRTSSKKSSSSTKSRASLDSLAMSPSSKRSSRTTMYVVTAVVCVLIIWFLLYSFRPVFVQKKDEAGQPTGVLQPGLAILVAFAGAAVIVILLYILMRLLKY
jgi:ABC-type uncharacterized transport system permease subunit